ncbi:hypothetical protein DER45DRAFT_574956 [Fusarium avenaceum]|nr:hypothetical protein DER45DRAFT_574956 [Fusarium avenaceum]
MPGRFPKISLNRTNPALQSKLASGGGQCQGAMRSVANRCTPLDRCCVSTSISISVSISVPLLSPSFRFPRKIDRAMLSLCSTKERNPGVWAVDLDMARKKLCGVIIVRVLYSAATPGGLPVLGRDAMEGLSLRSAFRLNHEGGKIMGGKRGLHGIAWHGMSWLLRRQGRVGPLQSRALTSSRIKHTRISCNFSIVGLIATQAPCPVVSVA